jgi:hypothetical protein
MQQGLSREQVAALHVLVKQPELFEVLGGIFSDMHRSAVQDFENAKTALVFSEAARPAALMAHGRVDALAEILDMLRRQVT